MNSFVDLNEKKVVPVRIAHKESILSGRWQRGLATQIVGPELVFFIFPVLVSSTNLL